MFQYATDLRGGGAQVCALLEWPVCYFYWSHKVLKVCVLTVQVSLMLSSLFTNFISLLIERDISFSFLTYSTVFCISTRKSFTTALKSPESAKTYNLADLAVILQRSIERKLFFMVTEC